MRVPEGFVWGAATAAYQIEGGHDADGKGPSVWDMMCRWPGKIHKGQSGQVACDHYHRYGEDVALMKQIGLKAYRFSISWPRVIPQGTGKINEKGLAFYDKLVDELLKADIQPWVTLFHWDYPLALFNRGGWLNRDSAEWFAEYSEAVADRLGDRVEQWITLNEPQCFIFSGHGQGDHAPGIKLPIKEQMQITHHVLMAHGRAVGVLRSRCKKSPQIGWAPVGYIRHPGGEDEESIALARKQSFSYDSVDMWKMPLYADPVVFGHYPEDLLELLGSDAPQVEPGDMELISQKLDFFGVNIYSSDPARSGSEECSGKDVFPDGYPHTLFNWPVTPESIYWASRFVHERYSLPVAITENGMSNVDWVSMDGKVHDPQRIDFTHRYLLELERAILDGIDVRGYFHWSAMDNFEWAAGYKQRFGLIYVDYATGKRTLKDSAYWYAKVIETNGANL